MRILFVCKSKVMENLGVMYLSSVVRQAGHDCLIASLDTMVDIANVWEPHIIGLSIMTGDQNKFHAQIPARGIYSGRPS